MTSRFLFTVALLLASPMTGLAQGESSGDLPAKQKPDPAAFTIVGTVRHLDLEGGGWVIVADGGKSYQPQNLADEFKKDGLRVNAKIQRVKDAVGILQAGEIVRIIRIEKL